MVCSDELSERTPYWVASRPRVEVNGAARAGSVLMAATPELAPAALRRWRRLMSMTKFPRLTKCPESEIRPIGVIPAGAIERPRRAGIHVWSSVLSAMDPES